MDLKKILLTFHLNNLKINNNIPIYGSTNREVQRFLLENKNNRYVLRMYKKSNFKKISLRNKLFEFLERNNFPIIPYISNKNGTKIIISGDFIFTLEPYIENIPLSRPEFINDYTIAQKIVYLYKAFHSVSSLQNFYNKNFKKHHFFQQIEHFFARIRLFNLQIFNIFQEDFDIMKKFLNNMKEDYCPAHGDFHPLNMIFTRDKTYLIDWEFTGLHIKYYDMALLSGCIFADSPDERGLSFIRYILSELNLDNEFEYIIQLSFITRLFWITNWLNSRDIEALKWEKYVLYSLHNFIKSV